MNTAPSLPENLRIYAIGDIHGRLDLLKQLLEKIDAEPKPAGVTVKKVFLGDYIDRGVQSKQVLDYLLHLAEKESGVTKPDFLLGNHEQVMRELVKQKDLKLLQDWLRFGGRETLMSYGIRPAILSTTASLTAMLSEFLNKFPKAHNDFVGRMVTSVTYGDYFFCHAGARYGVPLPEQSEQDLVWIRHDFLANTKKFEKMVVHGHTISEEAEVLPHRINVDTGAYATGCLTAIGLEGTNQWLVQTNR